MPLPPELFRSPEPRLWQDDRDLRRAVDWLKSYIGDDWERRRIAAFVRLHASAIGDNSGDEKGRFFDPTDMFGWYLFQAEAVLDHLWNSEPMYASRIVPVLREIGRSLPLLLDVPGLESRVRRLVGPERKQPNGGMFELLVAAAYRRRGAAVAFKEEPRGEKAHDLDVTLEGVTYAIECKRMETSEYGEAERMRMRHLWYPASDLMASLGRSVFGNVDFKVPLSDVPDRYLIDKARDWLDSSNPSLLWQDEMAVGVIGDLDLEPLQTALEDNEILAAGTLVIKLLTGRYRRHESHLQAIKFSVDGSPRYMSKCDQALILRWKCSAEASVNAKAKDVVAKLSQALDQLPKDRPGIIHVGLEAVEGDASEAARIERILKSLKRFDPRGKPLEFVYVHYFIPDSPPEAAFDFEERVDWQRITGTRKRPLQPETLITFP
ncbi:MAG: transposase [Devosia sp.]|uniref:transposase n=1 Tax=Devosia sp. TaxID=1871048 RepID=UPI0024C7361B|nr:transposase [Devosia sp.]UYN98673.1 MAG: transposase [Devosia sp.]